MHKQLTIIVFLAVLVACQEDIETSEACNFGPGDIFISEIMVNPSSGPEWIELFNSQNRPLLLNRAVITVQGTGKARPVLLNGTNLFVGARSYLTISDGMESFIDFQTDAPLRLPNNAGTIALSCRSKTVDELNYDTQSVLFSDQPGKSYILDGNLDLSRQFPRLSDWCSSTPSPGTDNAVCGINRCTDVDQLRELVPQTGVIISEIFANPNGIDTGQEWLELYNTASIPKIINGMIIENSSPNSTRRWLIADALCQKIPAFGYWVIGINNENIDVVDSVAIGKQDLFNAQTDLSLYQFETQIDYALTPDSQQGKSYGLDPRLMTAQDNDLPGNFCLATSHGIVNDPLSFATPGSGNDNCPP